MMDGCIIEVAQHFYAHYRDSAATAAAFHYSIASIYQGLF
jgi:hypothetical protein